MSDSTNKVLIAALLVVGLVALVAAILAGVAVGRNMTIAQLQPQGDSNNNNQNGQNGQSGQGAQNPQSPAPIAPQPPPPQKKIWTIHIGHDYGAHEYFDETGYIRGFTPDLIKLVCSAANLDCRTVWDKYENCWDSQAGEHASGGQGLLGRWYDGCMGWYTTVDRIHVFTFSEPYAKAPLSYFFVPKADTTFDPSNIVGKKIGFIEGWASDEKCLARASNIKGGFLPKGSVMHYADATSLRDAVISGAVDAAFASYETLQKFTGPSGSLKQLTQSQSCMLAGNAMMTRKDSELAGLWNSGYQKVRGNSDFQQLCKAARLEHGEYGDIDCLGA
jgi:ABC-type amino acid transport substrate-binding protein